MPIIILLNDTKKYLKEICTKMESIYDIEVNKDAFTDTKSKLSNIDLNKLYILLNCDIKPHRYVVYTLAKKQEASYCILTTEPLSTAKHDNPYILIDDHLDIDKINEIFRSTLKCSTAHKKKLVNDNNYLSSVKTIINEVNKDYTGVIQAILKDCEHKLFRMLSINPIDVSEVEHTYRNIILSNII